VRILFSLALILCTLPAGAVTPPKKKPAPRTPSPQRVEAAEAVQARVAESLASGIQNPGALVPFFEHLYRHQQNPALPLHVLQFGDSHSASDDWAVGLRAGMQSRFGDGGPGFTQAGRPYLGYRRYDSKSTASKGWKSRGLLSREGDSLYGLAGVAIEARKAGESITLDAEGSSVELFYWRQPGGGEFTLADNGAELSRISTDGELGPGYARFRFESSGQRSFALTTVDSGPVRLFGWVIEKEGGATWEPLGINGAQADVLLGIDEQLLRAHIRRRDPALIVLAYGTNEARSPEWTAESYLASFSTILTRVREAAPSASILVVGPPDHAIRAGRGRWIPQPGLDKIITAQRQAALAAGCAFWNLRAAMGGRDSMSQWVRAGLAQADYVHFTGPGYKLIAQSMVELLMAQFEIFSSVRKQIIGERTSEPAVTSNGSTSKNH
jgi:lysophospholipase L1-like esterase